MFYKDLIKEIDAYMERDPAAHSRLMVFVSYPGLHAIIWHRISHWLWSLRLFIFARLVGNISRCFTGIEIHPAVVIGHRLVIDHGMGVVIGETAEIGDDVTLYHGVTLGGITPSIESERQKFVKRHPTICDGAIIGSGAQILGPLIVGRNSRVGANAVVVRDVPEGVTVVGIPAKPVEDELADADHFAAYGTPTTDMPDREEILIAQLLSEVSLLRRRVNELESNESGDNYESPNNSENESNLADV